MFTLLLLFVWCAGNVEPNKDKFIIQSRKRQTKNVYIGAANVQTINYHNEKINNFRITSLQ